MECHEAVKRINRMLKEKTGKAWSVTGGRGTMWSWIRVQAPKSRRVSHRNKIEYVDEEKENQYTSNADRELLAEAFGLPYVHFQGVSISPKKRENFVKMVEKEPEDEGDPTDMPLDHPCQLCGRNVATICTECYDEVARRTIVERAAAELLDSCREAEKLLSLPRLGPVLHRLRNVLKQADPSFTWTYTGGKE